MVDERKVIVTEELKEKFSRARAAILADFRGLNVQQMNLLRKRLREHSIEYKVVKNTLAKRALQQIRYQAAGQLFEGPVSVAFSFNDQVAPARIMTEFAKQEPGLKITGGLLDGKVITPQQVDMLATLPPREVLLSKALAGMKSPTVGLVSALGGVIRNLIYTLKAIQEKRASTGE